jgi:hypothetical protein
LPSLAQEATTGFEPVNEGFADPCLTTWLRRRESHQPPAASHQQVLSLG